MLYFKAISPESFKKWLSNDRENIVLFRLAIIISAMEFIWMKILYPFPNFMPPDSNSYLEAAYLNQFINSWAIGYSKFLRLVSSFSNSHFFLVLLQYIILQCCTLYFLLSIRYLLSPQKWVFRALLFISLGNPLLVHISNFVSSDGLFISLSFLWLAQLLWIVYNPTTSVLFSHAIIILLAFMVRYTAIYYPVISILIIATSSATSKTKYLSIGLIVALIGLFVGRSAYEYKVKTNTIQYSAFAGWQMASNALYGYAFAKPDAVEEVPMQFRKLHAIVNRQMESLKKYPVFLRPDHEVAVYYLWDFNSPLRLYMNSLFPKKISESEYFYYWAKMAPLYASYGKFLIKRHPIEFAEYYLWPNFLKYFSPPVKFMGIYNMKNKTVEPVVVNWFGWKDNSLPSLLKDKEINITKVFQIVFGTTNIVFILGFIAFLLLDGFKVCTTVIKKMIWLIFLVWILNLIFSVFAAPIELRYEIFPLIILLCFSGLFMSYVVSSSRNAKALDLSSLREHRETNIQESL
jgi:hypothetical protein